MEINEIIELLFRDEDCILSPPSDLPSLPAGIRLPVDLKEFYSNCGGCVLFGDEAYGIEIVPPDEFKRANPVIVGEECQVDISYDWFIVARVGSQYITIDLNADRARRCYDSFWDCHGVAGECAVIATTFSELMKSLLRERGKALFWTQPDFAFIGDAYG